MSVDYKALYCAMQQQNGELSLMVDKYQREIIPQYERLLEMARAERDANAQAVKTLTAERDAALSAVQLYAGCLSCKHKREPCDYRACGTDGKLWEWAGPPEVKHE